MSDQPPTIDKDALERFRVANEVVNAMKVLCNHGLVQRTSNEETFSAERHRMYSSTSNDKEYETYRYNCLANGLVTHMLENSMLVCETREDNGCKVFAVGALTFNIPFYNKFVREYTL